MASETIDVKIKAPDNFYFQRRLGVIKIDHHTLGFDADRALQVMSSFLVLRAESIFFEHRIEYTVASSLLPSLPEGVAPPEYEMELRDWPTGETEIVKIRRADSGEVVYQHGD